MRNRTLLLGLMGLCAVSQFIRPAMGIDAVFIPGSISGPTYILGNGLLGGGAGGLEVQGSNGRIDLPVTFQSASVDPSKIFSVAGATTDGTTLYTLLSSSIPSTNSDLVLTNAQTGAYLGQTQLNASLSDIAYTNGQLYGIVTNPTSLQIDTIAANGSTQNVLSQAMSNSSATWRLSGVIGGSNLLVARDSFASSNVPGYVINPSSFQVSQITLSGTASRQLSDTVINSVGTAVASIVAGTQPITSFPSGVSLGNRATGTLYGTGFVSNAVSDEFSYNYSPTSPAVVQTTWNVTSSPLTGTIDGLTRTPQVVTASGPINITNYASPDGTTVSNVNTTNAVMQFFGPQFGTTPFTINVQNTSPGDLSNRTVGQATASLDLFTAERGLYSISASSTMTGDYSYSSTVDHNRMIQAATTGSLQFAYDPISSNLVGNGDAALTVAGWEGIQGTVPSFMTGFVNPSPSTHSFRLIPQTNFPAAIRQTLQIPTPNSPMLLSFTYDLETASTPDEIQVFLNNTEIADVTATSTSVLTFQTTITDPTLENLSNAVILFNSLSNSTNGNFVDVGNISLTGVPEPSTGMIVIVAVAALSRRKARNVK